MTRGKRSFDPRSDETDDWSSFVEDPWRGARGSMKSRVEVVGGVPQDHFFNRTRTTWTSPIARYHREFIDRRIRQRDSVDKSHMANVMSWLLWTSLLGLREFTAHKSSDVISQELQAPLFPAIPVSSSSSSSSSSSAFLSSAGNLDNSAPRHGNFITSPPCDLPSRANSLEKNLHASTEYNSHLYGSTPVSIVHFTESIENNGDFLRRDTDVLKNDPPSANQLDFRGFNYEFDRNRIQDDEYVGQAMNLVFAWSTIDFEFESIEARDSAIFDGDYIAENNLPLGLEIYRDKVFVTLPKWKQGIPATLATIPKYSSTKNPKLRPYPNWDWHRSEDCSGLTSVFRIQVDDCDRLWVLDSGKVDLAKKAERLCPPALFVFDLRTDMLIRKYELPKDHVKQDSLYTNIVVDVRNGDCVSATAYLSDVWRFGIVVYDFFKDASFRVEHHFFFPDPLASKYELHGVKFRWTDGIFGMALSPIDIHEDKTLFFHPMSSFREFAVSTSIFRNKRTAEENGDKFTPIGRPRAKDYGHSSGSAIDKNGVMFFNMVTRDSVWCWDTRKEYIPQNLGVIGTSNESLIFPNDIKVDHDEPEQSVWLISNKLPMYLYGILDSGKINYRVYKANVKEAIKGTVCDPNYVVPDYGQGYDETC